MEATQAVRIVRVTIQSPDAYFKALARLHATEIRDGFLTSFGMPVLESLYRQIGDAPQACLLAAIADDQVVGLICAATSTGSIYRRLLMRSWWLIPKLIPHVASLSRLRGLGETLVYPLRRRGESQGPEILNFCVDSRRQREGIGRRLFASLIETLDVTEGTRLRIVTGSSQRSAQQFYESQGATLVGETSVHRGVKSLVYVYEIPRRSATSAAA